MPAAFNIFSPEETVCVAETPNVSTRIERKDRTRVVVDILFTGNYFSNPKIESKLSPDYCVLPNLGAAYPSPISAASPPQAEIAKGIHIERKKKALKIIPILKLF